MDHGIPEEFRKLQELTRNFVEKELRPHEAEVDRTDVFPAELRARLRRKSLEVGLYAYNMPVEVGGPGLPWLAQVLLREQLGHVSQALADAVGRPPKALLACQGEQRMRFLEPVLRAEKTWAFALTEPEAGSDAAAIKTRAARASGNKGGGWTLTGTKHFISHGDAADLLIVIAKTAEDNLPIAFLVEHGAPGFTTGRNHPKMGWRGYPMAELRFDNVFVPDGQVLGRPGDGLRLALSQIGEARMGVAAHCVGMAQRALDYVLAHARVRRQFGQPLGRFQGLQWMLADMALDIEQSRALLYATARTMDTAGQNSARVEISMTKLSASEMLGRVADKAVQIMGGAGYMAESPIEMIYRDARAFRIGEGTSEIQRNQIARALLGDLA
jgi:alkylation response protein AidB-like acyl-CoA dehydrogenase